jgi:hypothetical protein
VPIRANTLEIERGEFALDLIVEREIQLNGFPGFAMVQRGACFSRVMIAVVIEENKFTADFRLEPTRGSDLCDQVTPRKKTARLLAKADYRRGAHAL